MSYDIARGSIPPMLPVGCISLYWQSDRGRRGITPQLVAGGLHFLAAEIHLHKFKTMEKHWSHVILGRGPLLAKGSPGPLFWRHLGADCTPDCRLRPGVAQRGCHSVAAPLQASFACGRFRDKCGFAEMSKRAERTIWERRLRTQSLQLI